VLPDVFDPVFNPDFDLVFDPIFDPVCDPVCDPVFGPDVPYSSGEEHFQQYSLAAPVIGKEVPYLNWSFLFLVSPRIFTHGAFC
jgi:hypothetical protein